MEPARSGAQIEFVRSALKEFERPLVGYAAHLLGGDVDRARDVVQEGFVRLCAQPPEAVKPRLREWLYTVCRNLAIDIRRKERRLRTLDEVHEQTCASSDPEPGEAIERQETYSQVLDAMQNLSANQQEVVRLKFQHGLSYKQISSVTRLSVTNVGFLLHTALKTLRQSFGETTADSR